MLIIPFFVFLIPTDIHSQIGCINNIWVFRCFNCIDNEHYHKANKKKDKTPKNHFHNFCLFCNYLIFISFLILGLIAIKMKKTIINHAYDGFFELGNTNTYNNELALNMAKNTIAKTA